MDKQKIVKRNQEKKTVQVPIRITESMSKWLREKKYSPTGIFEEAVKGLGFKKGEKEE